MDQAVFQVAEQAAQREQSGRLYFEFLRVPAMSMGLYVLGAGAVDLQKPHREDEAYYVVSGRGQIRIGSDDSPVKPGTVVFVKAGVEHRFHSITEELTLLVFFSPAESAD